MTTWEAVPQWEVIVFATDADSNANQRIDERVITSGCQRYYNLFLRLDRCYELIQLRLRRNDRKRTLGRLLFRRLSELLLDKCNLRTELGTAPIR